VKNRYSSGFLGVVLLAGGCGGFSTKRFEGADTGGDAGETSGGGGSTAGSITGGAGGKGGTAGSTTGGVGGKGGTTGGSSPGCNTDSECPAPPLECVNCPDGSVSCPSPECTGGQCLVNWSSCIPCDQLGCGELCYPCNGSDCPPMELPLRCNAEGECTREPPACMGRCTTVDDCPIPPPGCELCNSGSCAQMDCINGACEMVCDPRPYCTTANECPASEFCVMCPDATCAVPDCFKGRCDFSCGL
jgi:hypothetical protein